MTKLANEIITEALETGRNQYHKMAEDHWSYQCSELSPCIFCQAIKVRTPATKEQIEEARILYQDENENHDLEIDDDALQSSAEESGGAWINAWVWVSDPEPVTDEERSNGPKRD